jgi:cob(I)alamin adenosyltransferase
LAINRVYTRQGDGGETALAGGQRVPKDGLRIGAYGTVDELNSLVGVARATIAEMAPDAPRVAALDEILLRVQHELFNLGSILATLPEDVHPKQARVTDADVAQLEREMAAASTPSCTSAARFAAARSGNWWRWLARKAFLPRRYAT